ncbi:MAG: 50S ribosomal protein L23 [Patescibacteria group bacterium]|jgi:large subunit ribosomal protein L23
MNTITENDVEVKTVKSEKTAAVIAKKTSAAKKVVAKKSEVPAAVFKVVSRFASETILAPLVTEKSAALAEKNVLVFRVASHATRVAVKQAIKELYNVVPVKVNVITVRPQSTHFGRTQGKTKGYKKAMVTLPAGKMIDVFAA